MTVARRLGSIMIGATVASLGWASPASAIVPPADGTYFYTQAGAPVANWQVKSVCIQANGTRAQADYTDQTIQTQGCQVLVVSNTPLAPVTDAERAFTFSGRARLTSDLWTVQISTATGTQCPDGTAAPSTETFAFNPPDPASPNPSVTGTRTSIHGAVCGLQPGMVKTAFTLNYAGPLAAPVVERFPANCDFLAGRPSICS